MLICSSPPPRVKSHVMLMVETSFTNESLISFRECLLWYELINYFQEICVWPVPVNILINVSAQIFAGNFLRFWRKSAACRVASYCYPSVVCLDMDSCTRQLTHTYVGLFMSSKSFSQEKDTNCRLAINCSVFYKRSWSVYIPKPKATDWLRCRT